AAAGDSRPAALDQSGADDLPAGDRPLRRLHPLAETAAGSPRRGPARRRPLRPQDRIRPRPRLPRAQRRAGARPARPAERRGGDRGDRRRPRPRPVDRGDVPALPPRTSRRPLRRRPRHPQSDPDRVRPGEDAAADPGAGDRRALAAPPQPRLALPLGVPRGGALVRRRFWLGIAAVTLVALGSVLAAVLVYS